MTRTLTLLRTAAAASLLAMSIGCDPAADAPIVAPDEPSETATPAYDPLGTAWDIATVDITSDLARMPLAERMRVLREYAALVQQNAEGELVAIQFDAHVLWGWNPPTPPRPPGSRG